MALIAIFIVIALILSIVLISVLLGKSIEFFQEVLNKTYLANLERKKKYRLLLALTIIL
ncbi:hypothetical protein [Peribacillus kribbensis]|uniref:hypothetical protein n=1 Tax=Peribacillus kribbensis TaxID=356658 RepID=UPI0003F9661B|nr:hypothetical protein [Peribacillus kribbensis]